MELVKITPDNLEREHICCAIAENRDAQVLSKKTWLRDRMDEGLVFLKGDVRGKCFIEYLPSENAWAPIQADGWLYIDCLWVSGRFKGLGYSNLLLDACIQSGREQGRKGLVALSSRKKLGFLSDPGYMKYKGFETVDTAAPYFELLALPFEAGIERPAFRPQVKADKHPDLPDGFALYYTSQCPFTAKYVPLLEHAARARNIPFHTVQLTTCRQARNAPSPFTTFSLFWNGVFVTHEILSVKKLEKLFDERGL